MNSEQFRICRLQVYNWGTFSGIHNIPIAEQGFLFVGRSGSGKSTLLDAFSALLIQPRWLDFNAAASEAERGGRDRNLVSYIRGAWAEQKDGDSGEIVTRYLRSNSTWTALALTYENKQGVSITLTQLFWLRGNSNSSSDVKRLYMIFEQPFNLSQLIDFAKSDFDSRKLKQSFPNAFIKNEFRPYCERFSHLLGIDNEMALRLLHKTQSAKNLGDLNIFLRDFMLDKPQTFEVAERLINEFGELSEAHQAVVTARKQVEVLKPAREQDIALNILQTEHNALKELQLGTEPYRNNCKIDLLNSFIDQATIQLIGLEGELYSKGENVVTHAAELRNLEQQHREHGGAQIEQWEQEKLNLEGLRSEHLRKRDQAIYACKKLALELPDTPQGFAQLLATVRGEIENWQQQRTESRDSQFELTAQKKTCEQEFTQLVKEVQALKRQSSNIPAQMLELRHEIASAIGVAEDALPFVGELLEVKSSEAVWQGAIERVMHGFALSILVDEANYGALTKHINAINLRQRLVYYRTTTVALLPSKHILANSLIYKLNHKDGNRHAGWLQQELRQRFDYTCVSSLKEFRTAERALTCEGQVKHNATRHEKDDRRDINDRRNWVLGFDNRAKLQLFENQAQELAARISNLTQQISILAANEEQLADRVIHCQTLSNLQWQEIEVASILERIDSIVKQLEAAKNSNISLQRLGIKIEQQKVKVANAECELKKLELEHAKLEDQCKTKTQELTLLQQTPNIELMPMQLAGLKLRYDSLPNETTLDNLDQHTTMVERAIHKETELIISKINNCESFIEEKFKEFKREWPLDSSDVDTTLASAKDYFAKLQRLECDGLPAYEDCFFELLQNQSHQNLAALSTHLNQARKVILEKMALVNDSLSQAQFNPGTYLHIDANDRQLLEVREFKQEIQKALSHAWNDEREFAEARFITLRTLVERLASKDPVELRWRNAVLDVRQHVEFIGREIDQNGVDVEIYRSGAGKSGGQRQKLATTCLAAALRYQLGGDENGIPKYAPVILDEAFDKADNEFTALAMNIFKNFGFQMIVATPLKAVMTLEPFIGGACFVDINDRKVSGILLIEYDTVQQKLNLPANAEETANVVA